MEFSSQLSLQDTDNTLNSHTDKFWTHYNILKCRIYSCKDIKEGRGGGFKLKANV